MWFKKKSVLQAEHHYDTEKSADGTTDMRTTLKDYRNSNSSIHNSGHPSAADAGNYFYLPALGFYQYGRLYNVDEWGYYWSSSSIPWGNAHAYRLVFDVASVNVYDSYRSYGYRVGKFE